MLSDEQIDAIWKNYPCRFSKYELSDAIAEVATAPLLARIAALERKSNQDDETIQFQAAEIAKHLDRIVELDLQVLSALAQADDNWQRVKELERELAEANKDASRYRWLRHGDNDDKVIKQGVVTTKRGLEPSGYAYLLRNEKLDAAIDAAMSPPEQPK